MPRIVIGADDHGLAPGVSAAIVELLALGRLSATSCMVVFDDWPLQGATVAAFAERADIGLHLTLTDHQPLGDMALATEGRLPTFGALATRAVLGRLDVDDLAAEIGRQVDRFVEVVGHAPSHVDGHHHVQQLPSVREALLRVRATHPALEQAALRTCAERPGALLARRSSSGRAAVLAAAGRRLAGHLASAGIPTNRGFTGVYSFDGDYGAAFARFLVSVRDGTWLMCHPGRVDAVLAGRDGVTDARERELAWLASDEAGALLEAHDVQPSRLHDALA